MPPSMFLFLHTRSGRSVMNGDTGTLSALPSVKKVHLSYEEINRMKNVKYEL